MFQSNNILSRRTDPQQFVCLKAAFGPQGQPYLVLTVWSGTIDYRHCQKLLRVLPVHWNLQNIGFHPYWSLFFEHMMVDQGGWSLREGGEVCPPYCGGEERALGVGNEENPYNDTAHV
jgi:hypothetical protein